MKVFFLSFIMLSCLFQLILSKSVPESKCPSEKCYMKYLDAYFNCGPDNFPGCKAIKVKCETGDCYACASAEPLDLGETAEPGTEIVLDDPVLNEAYKFQVNLSALPSNTDFYLLSDATGSMGGAISTVRSQFSKIVTFFKDKSTNPRFGVGYYRDERERGMVHGFQNSQGLTNNIGKVNVAISRLRASGGADRDEANLVALYKVATDPTIGWRPESRRIVVFFGDVPGHEPTCFGGKTITREDVIDVLKKAQITVIAVSFGSVGRGLDLAPTKLSGCSGPSRAGPGQGTAIAKGTGGELVSSSDTSKLIDIITDAIEALPRTFDLDASDCAGKFDTPTDPKLPVTIPGGETKVITQTLRLLFGACSAGPFDCDLRYTDAGSSLGDVKVKVISVKGC